MDSGELQIRLYLESATLFFFHTQPVMYIYLPRFTCHPQTICCQTLVISFMVFLAARVWFHDNYPFIVLYSIVYVVAVSWLVLIKSLELRGINTGCPFCPPKLLIPQS